jgi:hypothetical protein
MIFTRGCGAKKLTLALCQKADIQLLPESGHVGQAFWDGSALVRISSETL